MSGRLREAVLAMGVAAALLGLSGSPLSAADLQFNFVNPSFGGNPFNSGHLLGVAQAQNDFEPDSVGSFGSGGSLSSLFGDSSSSRSDDDSDTTDDDGPPAITIDSVGGATLITLTDSRTGETTEIVVP